MTTRYPNGNNCKFYQFPYISSLIYTRPEIGTKYIQDRGALCPADFRLGIFIQILIEYKK